MIMESTKCKIKILRHLPGVFSQYQPEIGKIYDAIYAKASHIKNGSRNNEFCVITVSDKRIAVRKGEFEVVEV